MYNSINLIGTTVADCFYDVFNKPLKTWENFLLIKLMPRDILDEGIRWGFDDTAVYDAANNFFIKNKEKLLSEIYGLPHHTDKL